MKEKISGMQDVRLEPEPFWVRIRKLLAKEVEVKEVELPEAFCEVEVL